MQILFLFNFLFTITHNYLIIKWFLTKGAKNMAKTIPNKQLAIHQKTHELLSEIKAKRQKELNPVNSFTMILHEIIEKAHKKECGK